ncbi:MAG: hypothetical protein B6A08_20735 [Sorangiineae bacterium NIC37A_2]|nr:MAG: hypothetical protein B6A08_20735 [Sorangiineae bacterium NIC37A_2]
MDLNLSPWWVVSKLSMMNLNLAGNPSAHVFSSFAATGTKGSDSRPKNIEIGYPALSLPDFLNNWRVARRLHHPDMKKTGKLLDAVTEVPVDHDANFVGAGLYRHLASMVVVP